MTEQTASGSKKSIDQAKDEINKAADNIKSEIVEVEYQGYKFKVDTGLLDDVDALEMIDSIENQNNMMSIVGFLDYLIGKDGYTQMKAYFVEKEGRFKISTMSKIYVAIFDKFDPKD